MKLVLSIKADTNDADYVTQQTEVTTAELAQLEPVFQAIQNFKPYEGTSEGGSSFTHDNNWPMGENAPREDLGEKFPKDIYADVLTEDQVELFQEYCPFGEYGIHTIVEIKVMEVGDEQVYYKHKYA